MNHDARLERRIPEFIDEINGTSCGKFGKPCNIRDYKNLSHFPVYFIYQFPISSEARQEMIRLSIDSKMPAYTKLSSETKDKRKIFVEMNKFIPVIKILNKKFENYEFYLIYSITPSLPANNKSIYIAVKSKSAVSFYNVKEEYNMYNDELDYALESAYEDGYYQALADMGYEFDDEASEDVDIFDEDCFDDAMEGNPDNKLKRRAYDRMMAVWHGHGNDIAGYRDAARANSSYGKNIGRRRDVGANREHMLNRYGDSIATRSRMYSDRADDKDTRAALKAQIMGDTHRDLLKAKKRDTPEKIRQTQIDEAKRYHDFRNR
jgi:hypothetical protein